MQTWLNLSQAFPRIYCCYKNDKNITTGKFKRFPRIYCWLISSSKDFLEFTVYNNDKKYYWLIFNSKDFLEFNIYSIQCNNQNMLILFLLIKIHIFILLPDEDFFFII